MIVPAAMVAAVAAPFAGRFADRFGVRLFANVGMGVTALGFAAFTMLHTATSVVLVVAGLMTMSLGMSLFGAANSASMLNTPPTFAWYMAGLVFQWLKKNGGLKAMGERNRAKAEKLYAAIDGSSFYRNPVAKDARSWMNVPFTLANPELDKTFTAAAKQAGLVTLEGHRSVGGMRASLYNAMPMEGVNALVDFMRTFEKKHG